MIPEKAIELAERANAEYLEGNRTYTSKEVQYCFAQRVIELTLKEALDAVDRTDLRGMAYTTYDSDMLSFCKSQVKKEINALISQ